MASNPESHANIIKEMRCVNVIYGANDSHRPMTRFEKALLKLYANRLEAAHRREVAELRECLKEAVDVICEECEATDDFVNMKCKRCKWNAML